MVSRSIFTTSDIAPGLLTLCIGLMTLFVPQAQVSNTPFSNRHHTPAHQEQDWLTRQAELIGAFVILCTFSMVLIYFCVPETVLATTRKDKKRTLNYISLEELNQIFAVSFSDCRRYYINHVARRSIHNLLHMLGLRKEKMDIEESMHFWAKEELVRQRPQDAADSDTSGQRGESVDGEGEKMSGDRAVHDEGLPATRNRDVIRRTPLPRVDDTGGSIGFQPG